MIIMILVDFLFGDIMALLTKYLFFSRVLSFVTEMMASPLAWSDPREP